MEKTITIGDKDVRFKATASTTRKYRQRFGRDLFMDINKLVLNSQTGLTSGDLECFEDVAYIMAQQADDTIPDDPDEWLDQFEILDIYQVLPEIVELWGLNALTLEEPKKKVGKRSGN